MEKNDRPTAPHNRRISRSWVIICHGNILRSQVLEQYLRYHASGRGARLRLYSAGIAAWEAYERTPELLREVETELRRRGIPCEVRRKAWSLETEREIEGADAVLAADTGVKAVILERMRGRIAPDKVRTFYEMIGEGEKSFEDTYDRERQGQDPERFRHAFGELERIAVELAGLLEKA